MGGRQEQTVLTLFSDDEAGAQRLRIPVVRFRVVAAELEQKRVARTLAALDGRRAPIAVLGPFVFDHIGRIAIQLSAKRDSRALWERPAERGDVTERRRLPLRRLAHVCVVLGGEEGRHADDDAEGGPHETKNTRVPESREGLALAVDREDHAEYDGDQSPQDQQMT